MTERVKTVDMPAYMRGWRASRPDYHLKYTYGLTPDDYDRMFHTQGGVCAICRRPGGNRRGIKRLFVDHNHATSEIRGLLCTSCNTALQWLEGPLREAMDEYLRAPPGVPAAPIPDYASGKYLSSAPVKRQLP